MTRMPAAFFGHGNPMLTLDRASRYTRSWREYGASLPEKPKAVLAISAHWYVNATVATAMAAPKTIHDFYGFPPELFAVDYPAPGSPQLAERVADLVAPTWVGQDLDSWGLDHGTWTVLRHLLPDADVPVVQLSIDANKSFAEHLDLGRRLAPLREEGVFVLASGNVVHNLRRVDWNTPGVAADWAVDFDDAVREVMLRAPGSLADADGVVSHPAFRAAVPTPDHFIPLLYLAGLAAGAGTDTAVVVEGGDMGALTMTSYAVG